MPKNVRDLGNLIVAKGFKKLPKVQKIAQSGHTVVYNIGCFLAFGFSLGRTPYTLSFRVQIQPKFGQLQCRKNGNICHHLTPVTGCFNMH